jgi:hypothetical protein
MRRSKYARAAVTALLALVVAALGAGPAMADNEPNDVISYAEGPIAGGVPIQGLISTPDDRDYYLFYANSQQQLHLTYDDLTSDPGYDCLEVTLRDTNGRSISFDYTTPPGVTRYFVEVEYDDDYACSDQPPISYRFELDPGTAVTTGAPSDLTLHATGEPNETFGQAIGPMGALFNYVGATDTDNDEDWFWFWVPAGTRQLVISATGPASSCGSYVSLYSDPTESSVASTSGTVDSFGQINQTVVGPAKYYIKASSGGSYSSCRLGSPWQFRIETPDAVSLVDPFPPPAPAPQPAPRVVQTKYPSSISLRRSGARYSGRVNSSRSGCKSARRGVLRRVGSGTRSFGSARTRANGTFTIRRSSRLRGRVYVVVAGRSSSSTLCRSANSRRIRG